MATARTARKQKPYRRAAPLAAEQKGLWGLRKAVMDEGNNPHYTDWQKELLKEASEKLEGLPQQIAAGALRYKRITEKQAFCVAKGLIEGGLVHPLHYSEV